MALAAYNGEPFLAQMLQSIKLQTVAPSEVVISDDHSSDSTYEIALSHQGDIPIVLYKNPSARGMVPNYQNALSHCGGEYIALSDQDDVWMARKLEILLAAIKAKEDLHGHDHPVLAFCDLRVVDSELNLISSSFFRSSIKSPHRRDFSAYLFTGHIPGCAMVFNKALLLKAMPIPNVSSQDWWIILVAALFGEITYVDSPLINYRQHATNTVGLGAFGQGYWRKVAKILSPLTFYRGRLEGAQALQPSIIANAEELLSRHGASMPEAEKRLLELICQPASFWSMLIAFRRSRVGLRTIDFVLLIWIFSRSRTPHSHEQG